MFGIFIKIWGCGWIHALVESRGIPGRGLFFFFGRDFFEKTRFFMFFGKNGSKMVAIIQTIGKNGTLDPIFLLIGTLNGPNGPPRVVLWPCEPSIKLKNTYFNLRQDDKVKKMEIQNKNGYGTTLGRPFWAFRVPTKIL